VTVAALAPNWLGDLVMAMPALRALERAVRPEGFVVVASDQLAPLARLVAPGSHVAAWRRRKGLAGLRDRLALAPLLRSLGAGTVVLFPNSFSSGLAAALSRARERIGTPMHGRGFLLTRTVEPLLEGEHQADAYARVAASAAGGSLRPSPGDAALEVPEPLRDSAAELLRRHGLDPARERFLALAPGAAYGPAKHWGSAPFAELAALAAERALRGVIVGTAADRGEAASILASMRPAARPADLTGRTGVAELAGVLALAAAFVGNDSGAAHLAAAVGTPTVAIFLSTDPARTAPRGSRVRVLASPVECRPCLARTCKLGTYACREAVSPREVAKALAELLARPVARG